ENGGSMTRTPLRLGLLMFATLLLAQTQPQSTPGGGSPQTSPPKGATAQVEKHPLPSLPYTPSLDLNSMDRSAEPCGDFYQYVCGGWMKNNPIPSDPGRARNASEQKIGDFFQACMDEPAVEKLGAAPLQAGLEEIAGLKSKSE